MPNIDKIIEKFKRKSNNITFNETQRLLKHLGYKINNKGKTSGSRVLFYKNNAQNVILHKPHPRNTLLSYQLNTIIEVLKKEGKIDEK